MWTQESNSDGRILHKSTSPASTQDTIKPIVLGAADLAFSLFHNNLEDESMYCIFDWNFASQTLLISITDPTKSKLAKQQVQLVLENYAEYLSDKEDQQEQILLWLHNHLTTSAEFLQYSLVAAITADGDMSNSQLM